MSGFLRRVLGFDADRDGRSHALEALATEPIGAAAFDPAVGTPETGARGRGHRRAADSAERMLHDSLATKVLHAWRQNRQQTLFPLALDLRSVTAAERALVLQALAAALGATTDRVEKAERLRLTQAMTRLGAPPEPALVEAALAAPLPLPALVAALREAGLGAYAYAGSLLVLARPDAAGRSYLDYLAARLALPAALTESLARRYRG